MKCHQLGHSSINMAAYVVMVGVVFEAGLVPMVPAAAEGTVIAAEAALWQSNDFPLKHFSFFIDFSFPLPRWPRPSFLPPSSLFPSVTSLILCQSQKRLTETRERGACAYVLALAGVCVCVRAPWFCMKRQPGREEPLWEDTGGRAERVDGQKDKGLGNDCSKSQVTGWWLDKCRC